MIDEIFDRQYQAARKDMGAAIAREAARLAKGLGNAFGALNRAFYSAPWTARRPARVR